MDPGLFEAPQTPGAVFAAVGFADTLPLVHTPMGCALYDGNKPSAIFTLPGADSSGHREAERSRQRESLINGLAEACRSHSPKMIALSTTCPAEGNGDDPVDWIRTAKREGNLPAGLDVSLVHIPSFDGSHLDGYDRQLHDILRHLWEGVTETGEPEPGPNDNSINFIGGFDDIASDNLRELKRILNLMRVDFTLLGDCSDTMNTKVDASDRMGRSGTPLKRAAQAVRAKATIAMQAFCSETTLVYIAECGQEILSLNYPMGVGATDGFLMAISRLSGKSIPEALEIERGRLLDAIADASAHIHGKSFAIFGDPDRCLGLAGLLLELGAEPRHIVSTHGGKLWADKASTILGYSPFGQNGRVHPGKDMGFLRSLLFTDPVDFLIGDAEGEHLQRDTGTPLISLGFPAHQRHRRKPCPAWGYRGGLHVLSRILDRIFDENDRHSKVPSKTDYSFDIIR